MISIVPVDFYHIAVVLCIEQALVVLCRRE